MTLRVRFGVWVSLLLVVVLGAFGTFVYLAVAGWLAASVDDSLRLSATQVIETIDVEQGRIDLSDNPVTKDSGLADELRAKGLTIQILEADGSPVKSFGPSRNLAVDPGALAAAVDRQEVTLVTRPERGRHDQGAHPSHHQRRTPDRRGADLGEPQQRR